MGDGGDFDNEAGDEDDALWSLVAKSVEPLPGREAKVPAPDRPMPPKRRTVKQAQRPPEETPPPRQPQSREVDRRTAERLRRGRMKIEARLDLHGMGRVQAQAALQDFLHRCYRQELRHVLVITGKGLRGGEDGGRGPGILRRSVPQWLDEAPLSQIVLQFYNARRHHGGEGALYVLLRRKRGEG